MLNAKVFLNSYITFKVQNNPSNYDCYPHIITSGEVGCATVLPPLARKGTELKEQAGTECYWSDLQYLPKLRVELFIKYQISQTCQNYYLPLTLRLRSINDRNVPMLHNLNKMSV